MYHIHCMYYMYYSCIMYYMYSVYYNMYIWIMCIYDTVDVSEIWQPHQWVER